MSLQRIDPGTERRDDVRQIANEPQYGPWLDTVAAARYLSYTGKHPRRSVYKFIQRHGLIVWHDGARVLIARADVDQALSHARQSPSPRSSAVLVVSGKSGDR